MIVVSDWFLMVARRMQSTFVSDSDRTSSYFLPSRARVVGVGALLYTLLLGVDFIVLPPGNLQGVVVANSVALAGLLLGLLPDAEKSANIRSLIWLSSTTLALPTGYLIKLSIYSLTVPATDGMLLYWAAQYLLALGIYTQLINSLLVSFSGFIFSFLVWWLVSQFVYPSYPEQHYATFVSLFGAYATMVVFGSITNRTRTVVRAETTSAARSIGRNIAFEMREPLQNIVRNSEYSQPILDKIVGRARDKLQGGHSQIGPRQLDLVQAASNDIKHEAEQARTLIDMLQVNTAERPTFGQALRNHNMSDIVTEAIDRYPFSSTQEREMVHLKIESDFSVVVPRVLVVHVIFNLVKNSLYYVQKTDRRPRVDVTVRSSVVGDGGLVSVWDNGPGVSPSDRERIFERFYSTTETGRGAGIGLSFCADVMSQIGGAIDLDTKEGVYCSFNLSFHRGPEPDVDLIP